MSTPFNLNQILRAWIGAFAALLLTCASSQAQRRPDSIRLLIQMGDLAVPGETLRLIILPAFVYGTVQQNVHQAVDAVGDHGTFRFAVPNPGELVYFMVMIPFDSSSNNVLERIADEGYLEPGDRLVMTVSPWPDPSQSKQKYRVVYSGRGAAKNNCLEKIRWVEYHTSGPGTLLDEQFQPVDSNIYRKRVLVLSDIVEQYRSQLTPGSFDQLRVDVQYRYGDIVMNNLRYIYQRAQKAGQGERVARYVDSISRQPLAGSPAALARSRYFAGYVIRRMMVGQLIARTKFSFNHLYDDLKKWRPPVRDRLMVELLATYSPVLPQFDSLLMDARTQIDSRPFTLFAAQFGNAKVGDKAVDFQLEDSQGRLVRMADFAGKIVFMDFWFTGCTACIQYYQQVVDPVRQRYKQNAAVAFVSISVDRSRKSWLSSIASGKYTREDHINLFTNGQGANHPLVQQYNLAGYPSPILIGADGKVAVIRDSRLMLQQSLTDSIEVLLQKRKSITATTGSAK